MPGFFDNAEALVDDETMKECLIYLLCGINSKHLQINFDDKSILYVNPTYANKNIVKTFESHCIATKNIKRFVCQKNYMTDIFKKTICSYFVEREEEYYKNVLKCQNKEIEEIYTFLSPFINEFGEYNFLINSIDILSTYEVLTFLYDRKAKIKENCYEKLIYYIEVQIEEMVLDWIVLGICHANFFIKQNTSPLEFDESQWKHSYKMIQNPPLFVKKYTQEIFDSGLFINIAKKMNLDIQVKNERDLTKYTLEDNISYYYMNHKQNFQISVSPILSKELKTYQSIYFLKNTGKLTDMYDFLGSKIFEPLEQSISKINNVSATKYKICEARINHYILKILSVEKSVLNVKKNALENLCIEKINNNIDIFFSKEFFFELEIIHRFLMQMFTFDYIFNRSNKNRFTQNALIFLYNLRTSLYIFLFDENDTKNTAKGVENSTFCADNFTITQNNVDAIIYKFSKHIKSCLKEFYLTNSFIFQVLSDIFDLFISYIYTPDNDAHYFGQFTVLLHQLASEMRKCCTDFTFLFYLESFLRQNKL